MELKNHLSHKLLFSTWNNSKESTYFFHRFTGKSTSRGHQIREKTTQWQLHGHSESKEAIFFTALFRCQQHIHFCQKKCTNKTDKNKCKYSPLRVNTRDANCATFNGQRFIFMRITSSSALGCTWSTLPWLRLGLTCLVLCIRPQPGWSCHRCTAASTSGEYFGLQQHRNRGCLIHFLERIWTVHSRFY